MPTPGRGTNGSVSSASLLSLTGGGGDDRAILGSSPSGVRAATSSSVGGLNSGSGDCDPNLPAGDPLVLHATGNGGAADGLLGGEDGLGSGGGAEGLRGEGGLRARTEEGLGAASDGSRGGGGATRAAGIWLDEGMISTSALELGGHARRGSAGGSGSGGGSTITGGSGGIGGSTRRERWNTIAVTAIARPPRKPSTRIAITTRVWGVIVARRLPRSPE